MKKILSSIMILIILVQFFCPCALAIEIDSADIVFTGRTAPPDLLYKTVDGGIGSIKCSIVGYYRDNRFYPVYCLNGGVPGAETQEYSVNISDYINNEKVWRIVTNAYPYNNMGLSDDDAYMVTKIAIYCVTGNADFSRYTYDESKPITVQTYNALKNLVEVVAEDTGIERQMGTITITKDGNLNENDNYYSQDFNVNSKLEEESYEVKDLVDFPEGTKVVNLQNNAQNVFKAGENFRILIPKNGLTKDVNGSFNITGKVKNYPIFYGQAPSGYQNYAVTFDSFGDEIASENLNISCNTGSLKVYKVDSENNSLIAGVKFELRNKETNEVFEKTTNENGEIVFDGLYQGKYILKEIETVPEYKINTEDFEINIEFNKQSEITVSNDIIKGWVRIIKQDLENSNVRLSGTQFELYDEDMNLLETLETDEKGEAFSQKYPSVNKKYYLKEIKATEGYTLDSELKEINLVNDSILDVFVKNAREPKETVVIEKQPEPEIVVVEKEPEIVVVEKEPEVIVEEVEPEPIYEKVIIGQPKVIQKVVKLPRTGV